MYEMLAVFGCYTVVDAERKMNNDANRERVLPPSMQPVPLHKTYIPKCRQMDQTQRKRHDGQSGRHYGKEKV